MNSEASEKAFIFPVGYLLPKGYTIILISGVVVTRQRGKSKAIPLDPRLQENNTILWTKDQVWTHEPNRVIFMDEKDKIVTSMSVDPKSSTKGLFSS